MSTSVYLLQEMCCQYWPTSGSSQYGQYTVSLQNKNNDREYVNRTLTVSKVAQSSLQHKHGNVCSDSFVG